MKFVAFNLALLLLLAACSSHRNEHNDSVKVILDTDTNNELDDQHALAYLLFSRETLDVVGVTVNATRSGGDISNQFGEAQRVIALCGRTEDVPLRKGANGSFESIRQTVAETSFDGVDAVNFIIDAARGVHGGELVVIAVGKLTNVALAILKDPSIIPGLRIVWLGSNYPDPGEYNLQNDTVAMNYVLNAQVEFEMVTVRYGKTTGTDAVRVTREEVNKQMPGMGPHVSPAVTGRHGGQFDNFGDYSVNLFAHIDYDRDPPSRALFDMAAVAIVKNGTWAKPTEIPAPAYVEGHWVERPDHPRRIVVWVDFDRDQIIGDFFGVMRRAE